MPHNLSKLPCSEFANSVSVGCGPFSCRFSPRLPGPSTPSPLAGEGGDGGRSTAWARYRTEEDLDIPLAGLNNTVVAEEARLGEQRGLDSLARGSPRMRRLHHGTGVG